MLSVAGDVSDPNDSDNDEVDDELLSKLTAYTWNDKRDKINELTDIIFPFLINRDS